MATKALTAAVAAALVAGTVFAAPASAALDAAPAGAEAVEIRVLSNRADLVSGGDALVEIVLGAGTNPENLIVTAAGRDLSDAFAARADGRIIGLVDGLAEGVNVLEARVPAGGARISITNHPLGGPVFSGPQVQPWICTTEAQGLGAPVDEKCSAPPVVEYSYLPQGGTALQAYDPGSPPSNVSMTTTDSGKTVPFIVRVEKGSMNRGIYGFAALYDPTKPEQPWAQDNWDHKIATSFGGDCGAQHQQPGSGLSPNVSQLGRGFAQLSQGLFTLGTNCNEVVAAEALMMLRERVTEVFGEIDYAITTGCSGGSMMQLTISNAYPGMLDGINPSCTYPDQWTTWIETTDCGLLQQYFNFTSPHLWGAERQRAAVSGHMSNSTCAAWDATYVGVVIDPTGVQCTPANQTWAYDPDTNPAGTRCSLADYQVNIFGRRPESVWTDNEKKIGHGFANRILDNVGVQYGLRALQSREIVPAQFVDLNEKVGGWDIDGNWQEERHAADPEAVATAYRAGRITQGHNLDQVAIIDSAQGIANGPFLDNAEFHTSFRSYMLDDRLAEYTGSTANHAIARGGRPDAFDVLDEWISAVHTDTSDDPRPAKIARHRPALANDDCQIGSVRVSDPAACRSAYPYFGDPRIAAGGPSTDDVVKCQLKPLDREDPDYTAYGVTFTDGDWERLTATFPDGVCDYTKPSIGEQPVVGWLTYATAPGGTPLGEPPTSVPLGSSGDVCGGAPQAGVVDRGAARRVHRAAVDCVIFTQISVGVAADRYGPQRPVTRGQMASFLVNTLRVAGFSSRLPNGGGDPEFADIANNVHARSINRLARAGVVQGDDGRFKPKAHITRAQMASLMVSAANVAGVTLRPDGGHFDDVSGVHADSINAGYEAGLFAGTANAQFSPQRDVLRDQMATFLVNLLKVTTDGPQADAPRLHESG